jgi:hypothetical protein
MMKKLKLVLVISFVAVYFCATFSNYKVSSQTGQTKQPDFSECRATLPPLHRPKLRRVLTI